MVISTQHLVPSESTKSKGATAAPDPTPQPGKWGVLGHPLPYPLHLDARVGTVWLNCVAFFFLPSFSLLPAILVPHQGSVTNPPSITDGAENGPSTSAPSPASGDTNKADEDAEEAAPTPMDVDKEKPEDSKNQTPVPSSRPTPQPQTQQQQQQSGQGQQGPSQQPSKEAATPQIDLLLEASKLPLDVAIFNSTRAAGGDDKIRKYLQAVLVVGGTALTPGMAHALESRYAFVPVLLYCHELYGQR